MIYVLYQIAFAEAQPAIMPDDDMVKNRNIHYLANLYQPFRDGNILATWFRAAAWMIMWPIPRLMDTINEW